jgi:riboflavin biosynthesis pyrimidine reductase
MSDLDATDESAASHGRLLALYPKTGHHPLQGLYLSNELRGCVSADRVYVYSNFISSLDGRIAVAHGTTGEPVIPQDTANPRDWRLLLELAAPADAIILSGRYLRQLDHGQAQAPPPFDKNTPPDIVTFREQLGLPPQPALVVVSNSLELPLKQLLHYRDDRTVIVATSEASLSGEARQPISDDITVISAGKTRVDGSSLVEVLQRHGLNLVYSIAGPAVMHTLLEARVLQRLYLTTVLRVLSGTDYATMASGTQLDPPYDFKLAELFLDNHGPDGIQQLIQVYDRRT